MAKTKEQGEAANEEIKSGAAKPEGDAVAKTAFERKQKELDARR